MTFQCPESLFIPAISLSASLLYGTVAFAFYFEIV